MIPDKKSSLDSDEDEFSSFVNFMLDVNKKHPDMFTIKDIIDEACTFTLAVRNHMKIKFLVLHSR